MAVPRARTLLFSQHAKQMQDAGNMPKPDSFSALPAGIARAARRINPVPVASPVSATETDTVAKLQAENEALRAQLGHDPKPEVK